MVHTAPTGSRLGRVLGYGHGLSTVNYTSTQRNLQCIYSTDITDLFDHDYDGAYSLCTSSQRPEIDPVRQWTYLPRPCADSGMILICGGSWTSLNDIQRKVPLNQW